MNTHGRHLLVEYTGCDFQILDDVRRIEALMNEAARAAQTNLVASVFQPFEPQGVKTFWYNIPGNWIVFLGSSTK